MSNINPNPRDPRRPGKASAAKGGFPYDHRSMAEVPLKCSACRGLSPLWLVGTCLWCHNTGTL